MQICDPNAEPHGREQRHRAKLQQDISENDILYLIHSVKDTGLGWPQGLSRLFVSFSQLEEMSTRVRRHGPGAGHQQEAL